jgi:TRAP-type C4-dicarboxylate transport system permease small subunit
VSGFATFCKNGSDMLERLCLIGAGVLLLVNLTDVMIGVFGRFYRAPMWTTDLARITLVWMVMLAAAPALKRGEHMAINLVVDRLPDRFRRRVILARKVVFCAVLLLMVVLGIQYAYKLRLMTIMTLGIKKSVPLAAIPTGLGLMLLEYGLQQFVPMDRLVRSAPEHTEESA